MITKTNYFAEANKIGIENLPDTFKKSHELVKKVTQDGDSWNTYNKNETIKRTIDLYFEKLSEFQKKSASMPSIKEIKKAMPDRVFVVKSKPVIEEKPEKKKNKAATKQPKTTKPTKESNATQVERIDDEITLIKRYINFHDKQKTRDQVMNLLKSVQKAILERRVNKNSQYGKEVMQIQDSLIGALKHDVKVFDIKIEKTQLQHYTAIANGVSRMTSIQLIKRYVGLQNKTGILYKVEKLRDSVIKFMEENKTDKYHKYLHEALLNINAYRVRVVENKNVTLIPFADAELNGFKEIWAGTKHAYNVTKAAGKAAIDAAKKEHQKIAAGILILTSGSKAIFIKKNDPRYSATVKILKYFSDDNSYKILFLTLPNGSGWGVGEEDEVSAKYLIKGTSENLGFIPSIIAATAGAAVQAFTHHHLNKNKNLSGPETEVMSVASAKAETFKEIGLTGDYLKLIGRACAPTSIFIYGNGGSGKSGLALQLADKLHQLKHSILYAAGEQFATPTFTELLKLVNISGGENFKLVKSLNTLPIKDFDVIVIDSKESANLDHSSEFKKLRDTYPDKIWIITSQGTKAGDYAGDGKWKNEVDTFVYCENGIATTIKEKNRWGGKAEIKLF